MKLSSLVALAMLPVCAFAQSISIGSPHHFKKVKPGASLKVRVLQQVRNPSTRLLVTTLESALKIDCPYSQGSQTSFQDLGILISMSQCISDQCVSPMLSLGTILHTGIFHPEVPKWSKPGSKVPHVPEQNFTVTVPTSLKHDSTAQLNVLCFGAIGVRITLFTRFYVVKARWS